MADRMRLIIAKPGREFDLALEGHRGAGAVLTELVAGYGQLAQLLWRAWHELPLTAGELTDAELDLFNAIGDTVEHMKRHPVRVSVTVFGSTP